MIKWTSMLSGNIGTAYPCPNYADKSIHVTGGFYGATVTIQGSNEPDNPSSWITLSDATGNALTFADVGLKQILENCYWIRPIVTGGAGGTNINVYLLAETTR